MGLNGGGYTFINPQYLRRLTNDEVQSMFTDKQTFLMRVRRTDATQPYGVLTQLSQYQYVCQYSFIHSFLLIQAARPIKQQEKVINYINIHKHKNTESQTELRQQDICLTEFRRLLKTFLFAETRRIVTSLF